MLLLEHCNFPIKNILFLKHKICVSCIKANVNTVFWYVLLFQ